MTKITKREIAQLLGTDEQGIRQALTDMLAALEEECERRVKAESRADMAQHVAALASADADESRAASVDIARSHRAMRKALARVAQRPPNTKIKRSR